VHEYASGPLQRPDCGTIARPPSTPTDVGVPAPSPAAPRYRILLVEDDPTWRHLVAGGLGELGFAVRTVAGAARAVEVAAADPPDAIVLDTILPDGDGFEACARLRRDAGERRTPILLLGGRDDDETIERAFAAGASDYVVKSTSWRLLAQRLSQLVGAAQLHTELATSQRRLDRAKGLALLAQDTARRARELVNRDPLTGLLNRPGFLAVAQALLDDPERVADQPAALLLIDLDRFQRLNETLGSAAGDETLQEVARRLRQAFRNLPRVAIGRLASDEFALLFPSLRSVGAAERAAQIAVAELRRPLTCGGIDCVVRGSVGIALAPGAAAAPSLLSQAQRALAAAKAAGGNVVRRGLGDAAQAPRERFDLETALHRALEREELVLHYQPIVDPSGGRASGVEALMRWRRDGRLVPPSEFIPAAEESGLVFRMSEWAIGEALRQVRRWRAAGVAVRTVSVNIHARHLEQPDLARCVSQALAETGLPPSALELELTETGVMRDIKRALDSLQGLKRLGVRLALDDFGTGYSSLAYLTQLPIDTLKIDRSFVDPLGESAQSRAVVRSITALAQALGLSTVAEGVETRAQLASLQALGCDEVQGYLYGRPMPALELPGWWERFGVLHAAAGGAARARWGVDGGAVEAIYV
jgi:diguanylate cyclase (GGDEF)-like protein